MKKLFKFFALAALTICAISCNEKEELHDDENLVNRDLKCFDVGYFENWRDYHKTGANNWLIDLLSTTSKDYFVLELQGDPSETEPVEGEYQLSSSLEVGTAVAGDAEVSGSTIALTGTYWCRFDDQWKGLVDYACCTSGTVKVGKVDETYTISIDAVDQHGCEVKLSYKGRLKEYAATTRAKAGRGVVIPIGVSSPSNND